MQPQMMPAQQMPIQTMPISGFQKKRGFLQEDLAYKMSLKEFPTGDEILIMIEKNKHLMTAKTTEKLKTSVHGCMNQDAVLTNFPTMNDVKMYSIAHKIASIKLKISIPRIDSHNQIFHFILSVLEWTAEPRYLRGYQGFERNKLIEERFYTEMNRGMKDPEKPSILNLKGRRED